jgi:hypothetical protein
MGRKKSIIIGSRHFEYQKDAIEYYRKVLERYGIGDSLIDEDFDEVYELLRNHPDAVGKIGGGVEDIFVSGDGYGKQCFHVRRAGGSTENFSLHKSVKGEPSDFTKFCSACRKEVEEEMRKVRDDYFSKTNGDRKQTAKCQATGEPITYEDAQVDHRQPNTFSVIVDRFIEINQLDLASIQYDTSEQYGRLLCDRQLAEKFRQYHRAKATLRVVARDVNLRRSHMARVQRQKKDITL